MEKLLDLNPAQRAAVEHAAGPVLVIAGAGSGKTRVLTARVARLLEQGVPPEGILAFTFTNRAAREMRRRIERTVGDASRGLWVGTFHATSLRILRREARELQLPPGFAIYDREDQESTLKEIVKRLELPEGAFRIGSVLARISEAKNALVSPADLERLAVSPYEKRIAELYTLYQHELAHNGALDFDDLIAQVVVMFRDRPDIAERYGRRFQHVLVDEYQDTNHAQFRLVQSLGRVHGNVFVVGDDDQSIYGWRGADLSNVLEFETTFPGAAVIRLEQNYRSTGTILKAANAVIANNRARKGKTLWSEREEGPRLQFALLADEAEEAKRIRRLLDEHRRRDGRLDDVAVLYRTNAQSRAIETELRHHQIPYEIVGGVSFYQRREVKDLLAYLRLVVNPDDAVAFWRVWNTPRRGLGPGVRALVEQRAAASGNLVTALRGLVADHALTRGAATGAAALLALLDDLTAHADLAVDALFLRLLEGTRYLEFLDESDAAEAAERRQNVEELVAAAGSFAAAEGGSLVDFLGETALVTDADRLAENADRVLLLTAHNAKGLEFPIVVVAGLEEGLMPHANSVEDAGKLEEERRLFYVALTRARDQVLLTAAAYRRRFDAGRGGQVSRFVEEIPAELLEREVSPSAGWSARSGGTPGGHGRRGQGGGGVGVGAPVAARAARATRHRAIGLEVYHETFGRGVVVDAEGEGEDVKFTVRFRTATKKVLGRFLTGGGDGDSA
jgi:DNA helicase II / ATP-dependent DNA helicase PcrA